MLKFLFLLFSALTSASGQTPSLADYQALIEKQHALLQKYIALEKSIEEKEETGELRFVDTTAVVEGRLTTESGVALSTADRANQTTIYFTPYQGSMVALWSGTLWRLYTFTQRTLALTGMTANALYDIFLYDNAGTLTLERGPAWTSTTARSAAGALALRNGVYVLSSNHTRRYLGTIRATSATQTQDTRTQRFVWNYYHRLRRHLYIADATNTWTYNADTWRAARASTANRVEYVVGHTDVLVNARTLALVTNATGTVNYYASGVGIDSTTVNSAQLRGSGTDNDMLAQSWSEYLAYSALGYHYLQWLERSATTTITVWGDNGDATRYQSGLIAEIEG